MSLPESMGEIKINNDVVGKIASLAIHEVEGVVPLAGRHSLAEMWGRKDLDKGVQVTIHDNQVDVSLEVDVEYGIEIYRAAHKLQKAVKNAVEGMTGLMVQNVNVSVRSIILGEQPRRAREREREPHPVDVRSINAG